MTMRFESIPLMEVTMRNLAGDAIAWYRIGQGFTVFASHPELADAEEETEFAVGIYEQTLRTARESGSAVFCLDEIERECTKAFQKSGECVHTFLDEIRTQGITVAVRDLVSGQLRKVLVGEGQLVYEDIRVCFWHSNWKIDEETLLEGEHPHVQETDR